MSRIPKEFCIIEESSGLFVASYKERGFDLFMKRFVTLFMLILLITFCGILAVKFAEGALKPAGLIALPVIIIITTSLSVLVAWFFFGKVIFRFTHSEMSIDRQLFNISRRKMILQSGVDEVRIIYYNGSESNYSSFRFRIEFK